MIPQCKNYYQSHYTFFSAFTCVVEKCPRPINFEPVRKCDQIHYGPKHRDENEGTKIPGKLANNEDVKLARLNANTPDTRPREFKGNEPIVSDNDKILLAAKITSPPVEKSVIQDVASRHENQRKSNFSPENNKAPLPSKSVIENSQNPRKSNPKRSSSYLNWSRSNLSHLRGSKNSLLEETSQRLSKNSEIAALSNEKSHSSRGKRKNPENASNRVSHKSKLFQKTKRS